MDGMVSESSGDKGNREEVSSGNHRCHSEKALVEWRSSEQVENGVTSTSPSFWDMDDDNDGGPKVSQLYGKHTWKIDDFSKINKRELRSNAFEVGGYKWYILIYPQGCDVSNHLSLFLCVDNHDKLLPGWSHFAQFTIAVVNKDPKRNKYSDTLHRFWKKEHDWGWKKFMELSKVLDGFIDANSLIIKAQVQVIRERADRPFRCLDCQYRRELIRVYLTNVEVICRRFVEERRSKLGKLIEDKARWSSFCTFWSEIDLNSKLLISREKSDVVLRVVVKHFFLEKEVSSTLVMDSLYSGLKCLEWMSKNKRFRGKSTNTGDSVVPLVLLEKDMFILVDDVVQIVERAAVEQLPPKDDKGPQNRTKDGGSGEDLIKDSIDLDERRLTELGRRTIETFALAHIFSKIETAYQEDVALKIQEELIREEEAEAASLAESEHKAKRCNERDKKSKKKQGKQKRNNRKAKGGKGKDEKTNPVVEDSLQEISDDPNGRNEFTLETELINENPIKVDDNSDLSDSLDCATEVLEPDSDTDTVDILQLSESVTSKVPILDSTQNGKVERKVPSSMHESLSTCSTQWVPSVVRNGSQRVYSPQANQGTGKSPIRRNQQNEIKSNSEPDSVPQSLAKQTKFHNQPVVKKEEIPSKETTSSPSSPPQNVTTPKSNPVSLGKAGTTQCTKEPNPIEKASVQPVPIIPSFQTPPAQLERSVSAAGRLGSEPSASAPSYIPQLYRNSMMSPSACFPQYYHHPSDLGPQQSYPHTPFKRNLSFGPMGPSPSPSPSHTYAMPAQSSSDTGRQTTHNSSMLEFPHLDIINDLLDDENGMARAAVNNGSHNNFNRQFSFPGYAETSSSISSHHPYFGPSDQRPNHLRHHDFVRNQWQIGEPDLTMFPMRNIEPNDGLSYTRIPEEQHVPYSRPLSGSLNNGYTIFRPSNGYRH